MNKDLNRQLTRNDAQMINMQVKRFFTSYIIKELLSNTRGQEDCSVWWRSGESVTRDNKTLAHSYASSPEPPHTDHSKTPEHTAQNSCSLSVGMQNGIFILEDTLAVSNKTKYILIIWSSNHIPWYFPK